jgi:hypothetical protein
MRRFVVHNFLAKGIFSCICLAQTLSRKIENPKSAKRFLYEKKTCQPLPSIHPYTFDRRIVHVRECLCASGQRHLG